MRKYQPFLSRPFESTPFASNRWPFFFEMPVFFSRSAAFLFLSIRSKFSTRFHNAWLSSRSESVPSSLHRLPWMPFSSASLCSSLLPLCLVLMLNVCVRPVNRDGLITDSPRDIRMALGKHSFLMIGTIGVCMEMGSFLTMCASSLVSKPKLKETFFFLVDFLGGT